MTRRLLVVVIVLLGHLIGAQAGTIDVVLVAGDSLPDGPGTVYTVGKPALGDSGQLIVTAWLTTNDLGFQDVAIYRGGVGTPLVSVARTGQVIDGEQLLSTSVSAHSINSLDQVAFSANPQGSGFGNGLYLFDDALGARRLAGMGDPMPDSGGGSILGFLGIGLVNDAGQVVRPANTGAGNALLSADGSTGALQTIARTGQPTPNGPGSFANVGLNYSLNDAGQVAFTYNVTEGGIFTDILTLRADPTLSGFDLIEIARSGQPAPGSSGAFVSSTGAVINANGQVVFTAGLDVATTGTPGSVNDSGMYLYDDTTGLHEVLSFSGSSSTFRSWRSPPQFNATGQIAFSGSLRDAPSSSNSTMVLWENGVSQILAREGETVPGGDGYIYNFGTNEHIALNDAGQAVFNVNLLGVSASPNVLVGAIYRYSEADGLVEVVRAGTPLLGSTIGNVNFIGNADLNATGLNASGQIAFTFALTDGRQGVAIWTEGDAGSDPSLTITSPEPAEVVESDEILVEGIASDDGAVAGVTVNGVAATLVSTNNPSDPSEVAFSALVPLAAGENTIEAVATDDEGNTATQSLVIEYVPAPEPLVCNARGSTASGPYTAECGLDITLDGSGSFDPDGDPLTYMWTGPFSGGTAMGVTPTVQFLAPTSDKQVSLQVSDGITTASCDADVTVVDTTPPVIQSLVASPDVLWPPNHHMVTVAITAASPDNCDAAPTCQIVEVTSNEPENGLGDGDTAPDWEITGNLTVNLRAERSGTGSGRIYTIAVECTDQAGSAAQATTTVTVPHNQ